MRCIFQECRFHIYLKRGGEPLVRDLHGSKNTQKISSLALWKHITSIGGFLVKLFWEYQLLTDL